MVWPLSFQEAQFTPAEVASCTGLALSAQRNWRSQGVLPVRTTAQTRFSPRDLVEIRLMVILRQLGLGLAECRSLADEVASSVLYIMLANYEEQSLAVAAEPERGERYKTAIDWAGKDYGPCTLSRAGEVRYYYLRLQNGVCTALTGLDNEAADHSVESFGVVDLEAVARAILSKIPRPLFTLMVPHDFV